MKISAILTLWIFRLLFWTDYGSKPMIAKSGMDGSKAEVFVSENIHHPSGICADSPTKRVYWVDADQSIIESIKFDGNDRRVMLMYLIVLQKLLNK